MFSSIAESFISLGVFRGRLDYDQSMITQFLCKEGVSAEDIPPRPEAKVWEDAYGSSSV
jgi:hypothetical protein